MYHNLFSKAKTVFLINSSEELDRAFSSILLSKSSSRLTDTSVPESYSSKTQFASKYLKEPFTPRAVIFFHNHLVKLYLQMIQKKISISF